MVREPHHDKSFIKKSKITKSKIFLGFQNVPFNAVVFGGGKRSPCGGVHEWREISI
jgi:hypothetical protein